MSGRYAVVVCFDVERFVANDFDLIISSFTSGFDVDGDWFVAVDVDAELNTIRNGNLFSFYTLFLFFRLHNHKTAALMSQKTDHLFHTHWPTSSADIGGRPKPTN